jgi:membrane-bound lytic murein transglycosylase B
MDRNSRELNSRIAMAAAFLLIAGTASLLYKHSARDAGPGAWHAPEPITAVPTAPGGPATPHGYLRRLKVVEPPAPGEAPRPVRDASAVAAETAAESSGDAGPASSPAPRLGAGSGAFTGSIAAGGSSASASVAPSQPSAPSAPARPPAAGKGAPPATGSAPEALTAASSEASRMVAHARLQLKDASMFGGAPLTPESVATALRTQIAQDKKTDDTVAQALSGLGSGASLEDRQSAVASALKASGMPATPEAVDEAMAKAALPPRAPPSPAAVEDAIRQVSTNLPDANRLSQLGRMAMEAPPEPNAPPPRGGVDAYVKYQDAFDRVEKENGLKPSQVVPFPAIESSFGANTGKFPTRDTLLAINTDPQGRFKPAQREQAGHDLTAMTNLIANGDLGGRKVEQIYGSNMGAIGITQFLPSSWAAYGRSMAGGPRDPWNFRDAVLSTGNFLERHGSRTNYEKSILSYNYSVEYQQKILQYGANVAPGIQAVQQQNATAPAPKSTP